MSETETATLADRLCELAEQQHWVVGQDDDRRPRLLILRPGWRVALEFTPNGERIRFGEVFRNGSRVDLTTSANRIKRHLQGLPVPPARTLL